MKANEAKLMMQVVKVTQRDYETVEKLLVIARLAKKHHRLAEMACNGEGYVRGKLYTCGQVEGYAVSAYTYHSEGVADESITVFDVESDKVEAKIKALVSKLGTGWAVEFQGDPRGNTVKVSYNNRWINLA